MADNDGDGGEEAQHPPCGPSAKAVEARWWVVDNSALMAPTEGVSLRGSPHFEDRINKHVHWQTKVMGCQVDEHWLQVGVNEFIPFQVCGHTVIIPAAEQAAADEREREDAQMAGTACDGAEEYECQAVQMANPAIVVGSLQRRSWADLSEEPGPCEAVVKRGRRKEHRKRRGTESS